jgi:hypothetical protein
MAHVHADPCAAVRECCAATDCAQGVPECLPPTSAMCCQNKSELRCLSWPAALVRTVTWCKSDKQVDERGAVRVLGPDAAAGSSGRARGDGTPLHSFGSPSTALAAAEQLLAQVYRLGSVLPAASDVPLLPPGNCFPASPSCLSSAFPGVGSQSCIGFASKCVIVYAGLRMLQ